MLDSVSAPAKTFLALLINAILIIYLDIGVNLTDSMYQGEYHGSKKHEADLEQVLLRAWDQGLDKMIITGGNLEESKKSIEMAKSDGKYIKIVH